MNIRRADRKDAWGVLALALLLWPEEADALSEEIADMLGNPEEAIFVAVDGKALAGFAQCSLRHDYVEGTSTSPVGYLEGIYVRESHRRQGLARELVSACEEWARAQNCTEFASDCLLENQLSIRFHHDVGFQEANRLVCFLKRL